MGGIVGAVAGPIIGGLIGAGATSDAASQAATSQQQAVQAQQAMFAQTQANLQPYMAAGTTALNQLVAGTQPGGALMPKSYQPYTMEMFQQSPEYQFAAGQDVAALNAAQNASSLTGGMGSNNLRGLLNYTQNLATSDYQQALNNYLQQFLTGNQATSQQYNTLANLAGSGQSAAAGLGGLSANVGSNIGAGIVSAGSAQAAGTIGSAANITGGINQGYNTWLQSQYLNAMNPQGQGASPFSGIGNTISSWFGGGVTPDATFASMGYPQ